MIRTAARRAAALAAAALLAAAPAASAQWGMIRMLERPPVTSEAPELMDRVVGLDDEQRAMADAFVADTQAEFERMAAIWTEVWEAGRNEARTSGDRSVWFDLMRRGMEFQERRERLRSDFVENAELVVSFEQQEGWERFERRFYRKHLFAEAAAQYGSVAGVTVDIEEAVETADLPPEIAAQLAPILDQYSRDVHRELTALDEAVRENTEARMEAFRKMTEGEGWDSELMQRGADRMAELIDEIRETNLSFSRRIANELPTAERAEFERVFNRAAFPDIYTDTGATARFRAALGLEGLSEDQRTTLEELQAQYRREVGAVRQELREAALDANPVDELMRGGWGGGNNDEDAEEAKERVEALSERYVQQIDTVLTPEQADALGREDPTDWRNRSFDP